MNNKITEMREQRKMSQTELAAKVKTDRTHLSKVENGHVKPSVALLERIAYHLNCSIKDLL